MSSFPVCSSSGATESCQASRTPIDVARESCHFRIFAMKLATGNSTPVQRFANRTAETL